MRLCQSMDGSEGQVPPLSEHARSSPSAETTMPSGRSYPGGA